MSGRPSARASHNRHVSAGSTKTVGSLTPVNTAVAQSHIVTGSNGARVASPVEKVLTLWYHSDTTGAIVPDVVLNCDLFPKGSVKEGEVAELRVLGPRNTTSHLTNRQYSPGGLGRARAETTAGTGHKENSVPMERKRSGSHAAALNGESPEGTEMTDKTDRPSFVFVVRDISSEQKAKQSNIQVRGRDVARWIIRTPLMMILVDIGRKARCIVTQPPLQISGQGVNCTYLSMNNRISPMALLASDC